MQLQPQINEVIHNTEGFPLYASKLQLRLHIDDQRFIGKSEMLELRCVADILGVASLRRESWLRTTIMALRDSGVNQRRAENGTCASARAGEWDSESALPVIELYCSYSHICCLAAVPDVPAALALHSELVAVSVGRVSFSLILLAVFVVLITLNERNLSPVKAINRMRAAFLKRAPQLRQVEKNEKLTRQLLNLYIYWNMYMRTYIYILTIW